MARTWIKIFCSLQVSGTPPKMAVCHYLLHIELAVFDLVFLQQEKPYENEIHWIMFYYY